MNTEELRKHRDKLIAAERQRKRRQKPSKRPPDAKAMPEPRKASKD